MSPPTPVPSHLSLDNFRRYEKHIHSIVAKYPSQVTFDPAPLSTKTFAAQLRSAMRSHQIYTWQSVVDPNALKTIRTEMEVVEDSGLVVARKRTPTLYGVEVGVETDAPPSFTLTVDKPTNNDAICIAWLLSRRILLGPVRLNNMDQTSLDNLHALSKSGYDIIITTEGSVTTIT